MESTTTSAIAPVRLNADHRQRCVLDSLALDWMPSPSPLVHRRLLERDGGEVARATSVVRYGPGARFERHLHELGEEIVVLEGVLQDEQGSYPAGTYLRNPPGSAHAPFSEQGCLLLVKLRHIDPLDQERVVVNLHEAQWRPGLVPGLSVLPLHSHGTCHTAMVRWAPGTFFQPHRHFGGEEIFVLDGVFEDEAGRYPAGTWMRSPHLSQHQPFSREGCLIFVKTGHLDMDGA
ncbi:MAG: cupin [Burkholderiales bacterium]|nr:MAG: cupin [Burkholderiales bacterium]